MYLNSAYAQFNRVSRVNLSTIKYGAAPVTSTESICGINIGRSKNRLRTDLIKLASFEITRFFQLFYFFFLVFDYRSILKKSKITLGEFNFSFILKLDERWKFNNRSDKNKKIHAVVVTVVS